MKLVTFSHNGRTRIGEWVDDQIYGTGWPDAMLNIIQRGLHPSRVSEHFPVSEVKLEAPLRPGKLIAIGRNYTEHIEELGNRPADDPIIFAKFASCMIGHQDVISWSSALTQQVDWEGELGVVIGRPARHVSEKDALKHIFGYTICNDISARDIQSREAQWIRAKNLETFCPMGPCIVTADEIPDPQNLTVQTRVNGELMQNGSTKAMIYTVRFLISYLSRMFTLEPGDVILTGTPSGVGKGMKPPRFLGDGDTVSVSIDGIGDLTNTCQTFDV